MLVFLVGFPLQILVAAAERGCLGPQRVVIGNLPQHPGVARHEAEYSETPEDCKREYNVKNLLGDVYATESAVKGMCQDKNKIWLLHPISSRPTDA